MNWSRFSIVALSAVIIILIFFPGVGDMVRAPLKELLGARFWDALGYISSAVAIGYLVRDLVKARSTTQRDPTGNVRLPVLRAEARTLARQIKEYASNREKEDPIVKAGVDTLYLMDETSREYKKMREQRYAHIENMRDVYRKYYRDKIARVRDEFDDHGIHDPELDRLYDDPRNYAEFQALGDRLLAMTNQSARGH